MHLVLDCRCVHRHMGGIGRMAWSLAAHIGARPRGHRVTALFGTDAPRNPVLPGVEVVQVEAAMIDEHFEQLGLPVVLEELAADLYLNPTFSLPALKTTKRQVAVIHDVVFEDRPEWVEPGLCAYLRRWSRFSAAHADRIVTVSDYSGARIRAAYGVEEPRITRIYNGISRADSTPVSGDDVSNVRQEHGLERPYLLYLGTLEAKKGTPELLAAFARLAGTSFEGDLVLAGGAGGPEYDLDAAVARTGCAHRVRRLGYVDETDKRALLAGCELFVYPSRYEGFGLPPLEAMALGIPCVASDATSIPEVVGEAAMTVDVANAGAFAAAIEKGLRDSEFRQRAREAGPRRASEFSWERAADDYLDLFESLEAV